MSTTCTNNCKDGCPKNKSGNGTCNQRDSCCKEKTDFQKCIQKCHDDIKHYKLQLRLLSDDFKKRDSSGCSTTVPLTKAQYEKKKAKYEKKIENCKNTIKNKKKAKNAAFTIRSDDPKPCTPNTCAESCDCN